METPILKSDQIKTISTFQKKTLITDPKQKEVLNI